MTHKPNVHILNSSLDDLESVPDSVKDIIPYMKIGKEIGEKTTVELREACHNDVRYVFNAGMQTISEILMQIYGNALINGEDRLVVRQNLFGQISDVLDVTERSVNGEEQK